MVSKSEGDPTSIQDFEALISPQLRKLQRFIGGMLTGQPFTIHLIGVNAVGELGNASKYLRQKVEERLKDELVVLDFHQDEPDAVLENMQDVNKGEHDERVKDAVFIIIQPEKGAGYNVLDSNLNNLLRRHNYYLLLLAGELTQEQIYIASRSGPCLTVDCD